MFCTCVNMYVYVWTCKDMYGYERHTSLNPGRVSAWLDRSHSILQSHWSSIPGMLVS